jgi:hypothetical protein
MTGMKEGVGENPFERDDLVDEPEPEDESEEESTTEASDSSEAPAEAAATTEHEARTSESGGSMRSKHDLPYIYRRDRVTDERDQIPFYLREETIDVLEDRLIAFENQLGEDVSKIDFRELALIVGVEHLDEMQDRAREWGYGMG